MDVCKCGKDKAVYYCKDEKCPNKSSWPYYCLICLEEAILHPHVPVRINKEINLIDTDWKHVMAELNEMVVKATEVQEPYECLINMSERLMVSPKIKTQKSATKTLTDDLD